MRRRAFVSGALALLTAPLDAQSTQSTKGARTVGVLTATAATPGSVRMFEAFKQSYHSDHLR